MKEQLTQERLKELLDYDPETGHFTWKIARQRGIKAGDRAGCLDDRGYIRISIDNKKYRAHRLAWLWVTGKLPEREIDHTNHEKTDNRWINLREVSHQENSKNQPRHRNNISGLGGVSWQSATRKWQAQIMDNGKNLFIGRFPTPEEAHQAYRAKALELGYHPNHGV